MSINANIPTTREISSRTFFIAMPLLILGAGGGLLLFTRFVAPGPAWALLIVFLLLGLVLTGICAPLVYLCRWLIPRLRRSGLITNHSLRESAILSIYILFNLLMHLLQSWNPAIALVSLGIAIIIEVLILGRG